MKLLVAIIQGYKQYCKDMYYYLNSQLKLVQIAEKVKNKCTQYGGLCNQTDIFE